MVGNAPLQELRSTFEALQQSRVALEERDFLIATHERSEAALADHANGLTSGLQSAAANIEALFNRCVSLCATYQSWPCLTPLHLSDLTPGCCQPLEHPIRGTS